MASAMDSGVDTGNDSNDSSLSSVQEKLSKMDMEISLQSKSSDSAIETNSEGEQDDGIQNPSANKIVMNKFGKDDFMKITSTVSEISLSMDRTNRERQYPNTLRTELEICSKVDSGVTMSIAHVQPASLSRGYELPISTPSESRGGNIKCVMFNVKDLGGVFVSGGPFGTEYKGSELVSKMHRRMTCMRHAAIRLKCVRSEYAKYRDMRQMCRAACTSNTERMRELLEAGVSPNCHDGYKRSPLHLAACLGYADMVKLLLDHGADPNAKDSIGNTPLHLAACTNHVDVITLLLKAGTRVSERDMAGHSPLQLAITKFNIMKRSIMPHPVLKEQVCQGLSVPGNFMEDLHEDLLTQLRWKKMWSKRRNRPYFWDIITGVSLWELPSNKAQVISMLTEYMRHKEGSAIDPDMLNKFESMVRVSDSSEEVESNIRDLLSNLSSLSLSGSS